MVKRLSSVNQNSQTLINVPTPSAGTDAANKTYVDSLSAHIIKSNNTDQLADINAALLAHDVVQLVGEFDISAPIRIPSDTTLLAYGATVTLVAGSHCNAVQNYAIQQNRRLRDGVAVNADATFTSATAAFVSGDASKPIRIYYNDGTYLDTTILSVTNGTTVELTDAPTFSETGLYFSIGAREKNIHLIGGLWIRESDNLASSSALGFESNHLRFRHVDNVSVQDIQINHVSGKYCVNFGDCTGFYINRVVAEQTHSDVIHINGPSSSGIIRNIKSYGSNDDLVSMTGGDFGYTMENMADTLGDISNVIIDGIEGTIGDDGVNGARAVLILGGQSTAGHEHTLDAIYVRNIFSKLQAAPVMIGNDTQDLYTTGGNYGRIIVDNGTNESPTGTNPDYFVRVDDSATVDYLEVRSVKDAGTDDVYIQGGGAVVTTLVVSGVEPSRVAIDGTVTNYHNAMNSAELGTAQTFTRTQTFEDTAGSEAIKAEHIRVFPKSAGGSASIFLDNDNDQAFEFFTNNGGQFGVYDQQNSKQPLTINANAAAAVSIGSSLQVTGGGLNVSGDGNFNGSYLYNVNQLNPAADNAGSVGISGYAYADGHFKKITVENAPSSGTDATNKTYVDAEIVNSPMASSAHRKAPHAQFIPVSDMESGWTSAYADGTVTTDTADYTAGSGSLKITSASTGALTGAKYSLTADWSTKVIRFFVKCDDWANINALEMMVSTSGYFTSYWTSSFSYELANTPDDEWLEITLTRSSFQNGSGTPDWATVNNIIFRLTAVNGTTPSIWVDDLTVYEEAKKPIISFVFDDGWESQFTVARPKLDEYGYKATAYIIPSGIGAANTFTQDHVDSLARNDWDISGHNLTNLGTLTLTQVEADVRDTKTYLSTHGYKGSDHYAYPNGVANEAIKAIVQRYFTTGRNINRISQSSSYVSPMNINSYQVYQSISLVAAKAAVDAAIANNEWLILGFHDIKTTAAINIEWPTADFNDLVDYIATKNVDVKTVSEVWEDSYSDKTGDGSFVEMRVDTINENTTDAGVTVDGVLLKDGQVVIPAAVGSGAGSATLSVSGADFDNALSVTSTGSMEIIPGNQLYMEGTYLTQYGTVGMELNSDGNFNVNATSDATIYSGTDILLQATNITLDGLAKVNAINERTTDTGVTVDGVLIKDGLVDGVDVSTLPTDTSTTTLTNKTLSGVKIAGGSTGVANLNYATSSSSTTFTLPQISGGAGNDTLVGQLHTQTLTNKRITPRVGTTTSSATPTINTDIYDQYNITALAAAITSMTTNLSGTPTDGQKLTIRIKDNGTARAITWGASFVSSGVATLLATTVVNKTHMVGLIYDSAAAKWVCVAVDATGY
jgi:peptidoglycan/xylan/chitin deacetylase (PgdA/CDA1 family)